jgi:hypothetical protein
MAAHLSSTALNNFKRSSALYSSSNLSLSISLSLSLYLLSTFIDS